jgi:hypothetical protein
MSKRLKLNLPSKPSFKISFFKKKEEISEEVWPFKKTVCESLDDAIREHPYLATYLQSLPEKPKYTLNLDLENTERETNLLYPLGLGIYAHIDVGGEIGRYNLIEPETKGKKY